LTQQRKRGLHPLGVSLIGLAFALVSGAINFALSKAPLAAWDDEYIRQYGYSGFTNFSVGNFFFQLIFVPASFIIIFCIVIPVAYALKRNTPNGFVNIWLITGVALVFEALLFWVSIGNFRYLLILGGLALGVTAVGCLLFVGFLNRILRPRSLSHV